MPARRPERVRDLAQGLAWLLLGLLLAAQIWVLYLLVPGAGDPYFAHQDKVGHALLFGMPFALALLLGSRPAALGILLHALLSEPLQDLLTTTRTVDVWDTGANLAGMALAALVITLVRRVPARSTDEPAPAGVPR